MKKLALVAFMIGLTWACTPSVRQPVTIYQTFIVWYDDEVGKDPLLQHVQAEKAEILYDYQHFNGMALRIPLHGTVEQTQQIWENIPGVLSAQIDQVIQLD